MGGFSADVTVHIDEDLDYPWLDIVRKTIRGIEGVQEIVSRDARPHLMVVKYDPERTTSRSIHDALSYIGYQSELIGL